MIHSTSGSALASMAAVTLGEGAVLGLCCGVGSGGVSSYDTHASLVVEQCSISYRLSSCDAWAHCSINLSYVRLFLSIDVSILISQKVETHVSHVHLLPYYPKASRLGMQNDLFDT